MADGSLPPQVDGPPLGRLDLIFGRPAIFPPPLPTQSFIFTFRWWGDTRPCILWLPPGKGEGRITHRVTCSSVSFRQYLLDMKSLHVSIKIVNGDSVDDEQGSFVHQVQSPRRNEGDTPRQRLLRRQVRLKKGWQDGDVIGSFVLPELKLNARGDYVHEARILDTSADVVGTVSVTILFTDGILEFHTEEPSQQETGSVDKQEDATKPRPRTSGIPVPELRAAKTLTTTQQENHRPRSRSGSFRESMRQKWDKLKSPNKQQQQEQQQHLQQPHQQHLQQQHQQQQRQQQQRQKQLQSNIGYSMEEKENQAPHRSMAGSFTNTVKEVPTQHQEYSHARKHEGQQAGHPNGHIPVYRYSSQQPTHQDGLPVRRLDAGTTVKHQDDSRQKNKGYQPAQSQNTTEALRWKESQPMTAERIVKGGLQQPQIPEAVVWRDRRGQEGGKERPASWGLYPLLDGAEPQSLVESGAMKAEDLPVLLQVLEGRSPELGSLDSETHKLLDGLDLSYSPSCRSVTSPRPATSPRPSISPPKVKLVGQDEGVRDVRVKSHLHSVFNKEGQRDVVDLSGVSLSGVWPLEEGKDAASNAEKSRISPHHQTTDKILSTCIPKYGSPRRPQQPGGQSRKTKIPMNPKTRPSGRTYQTHPGRTVSDKKMSLLADGSSTSLRESREAWGGIEKGALGKHLAEEEGSVLVVDIGTLTLFPPLLPHVTLDREKKTTGVKVLHRSRVCYLTSLEISLPILEASSVEWQISHTCASRQLLDHEIQYGERVMLKLPPVSAMEVLRGYLVIRSVCRRLGERESEEVGGARVSLMDLWQHNGAKIQVPLYGPCSQDIDRDSLTRKQGRRGRKEEEEEHEHRPSANLTLTARLALALNQLSPLTDKEGKRWSSFDSPAEMIEQPVQSLDRRNQPPLNIASERLHSEKIPKLESIHRTHSVPCSSELRETRYPVTDLCQPSRQVADQKLSSGYRDHSGSHSFNSVYLPTHTSPNGKAMRGPLQYPAGQSRVEVVDCTVGTPYETRVVPVAAVGQQYEYQGSLLSSFNEYSGSNNHPIESGGESPCIQTVTDYCADFINYDSLGWKPDVEREGSCRVHLEIIKGRSLPWLEGPDGNPVPPNAYVRTAIGFLNVLTNVCQESVNPVWSFAADVLLPYSQLAETKGSLILKVHHRMGGEVGARLEDPLLGFVSVDATSIWGGHVSLCGWYPLLDLRGNLRGHLKVSLTPHEPPHHIAPASLWQPISLCQQPVYPSVPSSQQSRHSYPQYSEAQHFPGSTSTRNTAVGRSVNVIPQPPTAKSLRSSSSHGNTGKESNVMRTNDSFLTNQSAVTSSYSDRSSPKPPASISNKQSYEGLPVATSNDQSGYLQVTTSDQAQAHSLSNKTSSIPVFSPSRNGSKSPSCEDSTQPNNILPKTVYREQENVYPNSGVINQDQSQHKGSIIVKAVTTQPGKPAQGLTMHKDVSNVSSQNLVPERENDKGSILIKDSILVSHFRMQREKEDESRKDSNILGDIDPPEELRGDDSNTSRNYNVAENREMITDSSKPASALANKPSSCLKVPGSPSLRAKHVTFANKLVHHENKDSSSLPQNFQDATVWKTNHAPRQSSEIPQATRKETVFSSGLHRNLGWDKRTAELSNNQRRSHPNPGEGSDLQVVPCREGDTQVVTTTVSTHGSSNLNGYGTSAPHDKNKADLIMAFSWMNQTSGCDTPCASFIESKPAMQNHYENNGQYNAGDNKTPAETKAVLSSPKKTRKLRSRLAANLPPLN